MPHRRPSARPLTRSAPAPHRPACTLRCTTSAPAPHQPLHHACRPCQQPPALNAPPSHLSCHCRCPAGLPLQLRYVSLAAMQRHAPFDGYLVTRVQLNGHKHVLALSHTLVDHPCCNMGPPWSYEPVLRHTLSSIMLAYPSSSHVIPCAPSRVPLHA